MAERIYISGAMASRPKTYKKEFNKVQKRLEWAGYIVINPAVLPNGLDKNKYMPVCLSMVESADAIYMLDGWRKSKGAVLEKLYAEYQGKKVLFETERSWRELEDQKKK